MRAAGRHGSAASAPGGNTRIDGTGLFEAGGRNGEPVRHYRRPMEFRFGPEDRGRVTLLFGGLTRRHDLLIQAAAEGLGYRIEVLPTPTKADYQAGREFCDNGMCNPTYFCAGSLINRLRQLRDEEGRSVEDILRNYAYITAGSCGPCRFGMYESQYRLALRNSGFDGFRVVLFQQNKLDQSSTPSGVELNLRFFLALLNAVLIGDVLNELAHRIRPYETVPGETDRVFERVTERMREALRVKPLRPRTGGWAARLAGLLLPILAREDRELFADQLLSDHYTAALRGCAAMIDEIDVDFTRPRPICKIVGEFWAQTTDGDGNYRMFSFLEDQGAEVWVEPVVTWIEYMIAHAYSRTEEVRGLDIDPWRNPKGRLRDEIRCRRRLCRLALGLRILGREYDRIRSALGGIARRPADPWELQRLAEPYYTPKLTGGEGHLEVGKTLYYTRHGLVHMVLGLKPFGCMPSTQSDGAQAAVTGHHPDILYVPIETSGEGDINAYSRVQMGLGDAKARCREEFRRALETAGYELEDIRRFCAERRDWRRPLRPIPRHREFAGTAANFVIDAARHMANDPAWAKRRRGGVPLPGVAPAP